MDDLTLIRNFRAEHADDDPRARAEAWRELDARFDLAATSFAASAARSPRRRLFALAGAGALAGVIAGVIVLSSGPAAEPAAAEILHETAAVAAASDASAASPVPGPGQLLYTKLMRVELQGWIPNCDPMGNQPCGGMGTRMRQPGAFNALMPMTQEEWRGEDGVGRLRQVAGTPEFLTAEEESRWKAEGSPLPAPFDPGYQQMVREYQDAERIDGYVLNRREERRGVYDTETVVDLDKLEGRPYRFPDTSKLPTDPKALRRTVEGNRTKVTGFNLMDPKAKRLDTDATVAQLLNILQEGNPMRPQLRAAIFNALAELPGIEVDTHATDLLGREGYAINARGIEYIFDPDTAEILSQRSFVPSGNDSWQGLPAGFTVRETAYIESAIVDSTDETGDQDEEAIATISPVRRK